MAYPKTDHFLCDYDTLMHRIDAIDPVSYNSTRNYLDGAVTWLSPFITHGIIDTSLIAKRMLVRFSAQQCSRLLFELAWREYFHRVWQQHGDNIFDDMRPQAGKRDGEVLQTDPPVALIEAQTQIDVIDQCITHLIAEGTMHNHARMWTASLACNTGQTHWLEPAKWLHYHLLDGDLASNTLSWQWVAGFFSNKRYIANQDNINKYSRQPQSGTFLDVSYESLAVLELPEQFRERSQLQYDLTIPATPVHLNAESVAVRSLWNLDPTWAVNVDQQIVFVDQNHYEHWPMSPNRWRFITHWVQTVPNLTIMCGTQESLRLACEGKGVVCREYPASSAWFDRCESRNWLYHCPEKPFRSFFAFWKQVCTDVGLKV